VKELSSSDQKNFKLRPNLVIDFQALEKNEKNYKDSAVVRNF